ncbi:(d)CMP kinase [Blattabacterium cuenoti]|uniref:(d)CMP kinase n=1 Tax=Blattabacterium cuenoti TaxID=1653831 RepID=UPI00163D38E1|nr:(d)CMP kinase [Blattabacterium cuenoti]
MNKKMIIAIDGYSSSGKSTLAKNLSNKLKYDYIDTGAMYRCIALLGIRKNIFNSDLWNITNFIPLIKNIKFQFKYNKKYNKTDIIFNNENVKSKIRSIKIENKVSLIARIPEIRNELTIIQKNFENKKGIVMDGRDIGSIIFPQSELKIFMKGSIEVRAYRRYQNFKKIGQNISFERIKKNLLLRDMIDISRKNSPLKKSINSIEIDNTFLSREEQLNFILKIINNYHKKKYGYETIT